jgi:hypothetical protein
MAILHPLIIHCPFFIVFLGHCPVDSVDNGEITLCQEITEQNSLIMGSVNYQVCSSICKELLSLYAVGTELEGDALDRRVLGC